MKKITCLNFIIKLSCVFGGIIYGVRTICMGNLYDSIIQFSLILFAFIPDILKKYKKFKVTDKMEFIYLSFLFLAQFLGSMVGLYGMISWYDTFVHTLSGMVTCLFGIIIYEMNHGKKNTFLYILFLLSFSALIAVSWEIFEFIGDLLFGKDAQYVKTTGVTDTMVDMIVALGGSVFMVCLLWIEKKFHIKGFFSRFMEEIDQIY